MQATDWDERLVAGHRAHCSVADGRAAFDVLVDMSCHLPGYSCTTAWGGTIETLKYEAPRSSERPLAFIWIRCGEMATKAIRELRLEREP